jgi:hypothetical protein
MSVFLWERLEDRGVYYLCHHTANVPCVGWKDERVVGPGKLLEGRHILLSHGQAGGVLATTEQTFFFVATDRLN